MSSKIAKLLTRLYPASWRKRYGAEFEELLETGQGGLLTLANVVWSGLRERFCAIRELTPHQDIYSGRVHSMCARAPWVVFSFVPLSLLFGCYLAACSLLWFGWSVFLPGAETPFGVVPQQAWLNLYFQFGKYLYGSGPILVAWAIAIVAIRQRTKAGWPLISFVLMAWVGAAARIRASRTEIPAGLSHIRMEFDLWPWVATGSDGLSHALVILSVALVPYLVCRVWIARTTVP